MSGFKDSCASVDLHQRLSAWDRDLPVIPPPSYSSLVDFLCRRLVPSNALAVFRKLVRLMLRVLLYMVGLGTAQERILQEHQRDMSRSVWYCPAHADDRFGLRPDETYFQSASLPPQVQMSYAMVIRGTRNDPETSILDGLGEHDQDTESDVLNNNTDQNHFAREANNLMVHRAASLILAILKVRRFYLSAEFSPDMYRGAQPQTMQWYGYLFSTSLRFHRETVERHVAPREYSDHVIVMSRGRVFRVELIRRDVMGEEVMPTYQEIRRQLERVVQTNSSSPTLSVSALTILAAADRFREEQTLTSTSDQNRYNLAAIRDSLFVVSLDADDSPRFAEETLYAIQSKNPENRWYDRSINLVVFGNGVAGFVMNYLAGMTGTIAAAFVKSVLDKEKDVLLILQEENLACHDQIQLKELKAPRLLQWKDTADHYFQKKTDSILRCREGTGPFIPLRPAMFKLSKALTRGRLIESRVSPAGTFNAALQLALTRMSGRLVNVFEIISIRHFRYGGLAWMETNTADMSNFITAASEYLNHPGTLSNKDKQKTKPLLIRAIQSYREDVIRHKDGQVNLWHLDALFRTLGLQTRLPRRQRSKRQSLRVMLQQPVVDYLRNPSAGILPPVAADNFISNPSWNPAIEAVGRVGVKCLLPNGAMALHYMMSGSRIAITVSTSAGHSCHEREREFAGLLNDSLSIIQHILDS